MLLSLVTVASLTVLSWDEPEQVVASPAVAVKEPALRDELVKRMKAEQDVRVKLSKVFPPDKMSSHEEQLRPEVQSVFQEMAKIDQDNLAWLKKVIEKHGWPGKSMVGRDGAQGAFLIAQHAAQDLEFMSKCLVLLKKAHDAGDAEGQWVALMTDRLLVMKEKKKQLYGTQLLAKDGKLVPHPIEDEANVDKRRKEMGMPSLSAYLKSVNDNREAAPKKLEEKTTPPKE